MKVDQFLCGISHTLSRPAKFISLYIYLSTREKCLSRGLAFSEPRRLDSNRCFSQWIAQRPFLSQLLSFGELIRNFIFVSWGFLFSR